MPYFELQASANGIVESAVYYPQVQMDGSSYPSLPTVKLSSQVQASVQEGAGSALKAWAVLKESIALTGQATAGAQEEARKLRAQIAEMQDQTLESLQNFTSGFSERIISLRRELTRNAHEDQNEKFKMHREYYLLADDARQFTHLLSTAEKKIESLAQLM